jgi:hypothetical protein
MDWEIIRAVLKQATDSIAQGPITSGIVLIASVLLFRRNFQKAGIEWWEAKQRKKNAEREERLSAVEIRMDALHEKLRREYKAPSLVLDAQAYSEYLKQDDPADIREILRRRLKLNTSSNLPQRWASRY